MKVLVADDDPQILRALRITLTANGYDVVTASDGAAALRAAAETRPDLYVLDLGMPRLDGVQVIQALRAFGSDPILVVSGRSDSASTVEALDAGADDYVVKPFAVDALLARLRALSRRFRPPSADPVVTIGDATVDLSAHHVSRVVDGVESAVRLTPTEWLILEMLVRNAGALVTRQTLLKEIWGTEQVKDTGYLRLYLSQLRRKLEPDPSRPRHLLTESGMGYRFVP